MYLYSSFTFFIKTCFFINIAFRIYLTYERHETRNFSHIIKQKLTKDSVFHSTGDLKKLNISDIYRDSAEKITSICSLNFLQKYISLNDYDPFAVDR